MKAFILASLVLLASCGSNDSKDSKKDEPKETTPDITMVNINRVADSGFTRVSFEPTYSDAGAVEQMGLVGVVLVAEGEKVPEKCVPGYVYKPIAHDFVLAPNAKYVYRACLYNMETGEFSEGKGEAFETL